MKTILLLGGSAQQIIAIKTAKKLGYRTVLCDYLADNPGQYEADKFYQTSTTDMQAVLDIAKQENIDGIIAYASDPAAPTAAYVAQSLGLPGNPYDSVEILCNKDKFRAFLKENGFNTPEACGYTGIEDAYGDVMSGKFNLPIIIKPVDSSGSKGVTVIRTTDKLVEALEFAMSFSRGKRIVLEEFIEKKHNYLIGGDIFIKNGKIVLWGLLNCHRDNNVNPLVPVGKSYPLDLADSDINEVKNVLQRMVDILEIKDGAMNVELVVDKNNRVWPIDIGPRNGGNMIPDLLGYIFDIDIVEWSVKAAMGVDIECEINNSDTFYATHNLHTSENGKYIAALFSEEIEKYILKKCIYKNPGDVIEYFDNAAKALGIVFMKFDNIQTMSDILSNINSHIIIKSEK